MQRCVGRGGGVRESTVVLLMATEHWDTVRVHQQRAGRQRAPDLRTAANENEGGPVKQMWEDLYVAKDSKSCIN